MTSSFGVSLVLIIERSFLCYNEVTQYYNHVIEAMSSDIRRSRWRQVTRAKTGQAIRQPTPYRSGSSKPRSACWPSRDPPPSRRARSRPPAASRRWRSTTTSVGDRKSTRLNSSHSQISYAVFCLKKKKQYNVTRNRERHQVIARYGTHSMPQTPPIIPISACIGHCSEVAYLTSSPRGLVLRFYPA